MWILSSYREYFVSIFFSLPTQYVFLLLIKVSCFSPYLFCSTFSLCLPPTFRLFQDFSSFFLLCSEMSVPKPVRVFIIYCSSQFLHILCSWRVLYASVLISWFCDHVLVLFCSFELENSLPIHTEALNSWMGYLSNFFKSVSVVSSSLSRQRRLCWLWMHLMGGDTTLPFLGQEQDWASALIAVRNTRTASPNSCYVLG